MKKTLITILLVLLTLMMFVACKEEPNVVTLHVPSSSKGPDWPSSGLYIIQALGNICYPTDPNAAVSGMDSVFSSSKTTEVTVQYNEGDTIYDVLNNRIFIYDTNHGGDNESNAFVSLFSYMTTYGIKNLYLSTTDFGENVFNDWNRPVDFTDLYLCFAYNPGN